ncbi:hypothetical protein OFY17_12765 [Marinomonas sp. C2222]|uniref:Uncharacterized protein n=1 Tax=Marinomonas sargassi TaxID=2984494 RepID=A0ABT2YV10_9GAMM|nr:hypothetical protein [Marinomonas sargassi]MCV2403738.1 hypothetical protein [Marinomonas sargassi]
MTNTKTMIELLGAVDTSHLSEEDKYALFANATSSEFSLSFASDFAKWAKKSFNAIKENLTPFTLKHA